MLRAKIIRMANRWDFGISVNTSFGVTGIHASIAMGRAEIRFSMCTTLNQERLAAIAQAILSRCARPVTRLITVGSLS